LKCHWFNAAVRPCERRFELLLFKLRDCFNAADLGYSDSDLVAGLHGVEHQPVLHLEFFASPAGIGADSTALGLLDRNLAGRFIDLADCAGDALLGNCALASKEDKHRTAKNAFCIFHVRLPTFDSCG
jgi:hypothetical protein